jgi:1-pyrroline-5-carboxylate dehydrogenase
VYVPASLWDEVRERLLSEIRDVKAGDVEDFTNYMGAVIDQSAFDAIRTYIEEARASSEVDIIAGGSCNDGTGFFVEPTLIVTTNPHFKTMEEEIFGPVVTFFVYEDSACEEALDLCESTSRYALTGAVFARDRSAIVEIEKRLLYSAGNLYINDKTTGAFVGPQPFGGSRASGTNEKVGSRQNVSRWMSPRTVKENFHPLTDFRIDLMKES